MADLFPTFDVPTINQQNQANETSTVKSAMFDFNIGDFATDIGGKMIKTDEKTAWIQWCLKTAMTERYAYLGYSKNIGTEMIPAMQEPTKKAQESAIERTLTEALMADPYKRTLYVKNFVFEWKNDRVDVAFEIGNIDQVNATLTVTI